MAEDQAVVAVVGGVVTAVVVVAWVVVVVGRVVVVVGRGRVVVVVGRGRVVVVVGRVVVVTVAAVVVVPFVVVVVVPFVVVVVGLVVEVVGLVVLDEFAGEPELADAGRVVTFTFGPFPPVGGEETDVADDVLAAALDGVATVPAGADVVPSEEEVEELVTPRVAADVGGDALIATPAIEATAAVTRSTRPRTMADRTFVAVASIRNTGRNRGRSPGPRRQAGRSLLLAGARRTCGLARSG